MGSRPGLNPASRALALALLVVGAALMVGAVFADQLGLSSVGDRRGDGFGFSQLIAAIVGLMLLLGGLAWLRQPPVGPDSDDASE